MAIERDEHGFDAPAALGHPGRAGLPEGASTGPVIGERLPDFELPDAHGKLVSFHSDRAGKKKRCWYFTAQQSGDPPAGRSSVSFATLIPSLNQMKSDYMPSPMTTGRRSPSSPGNSPFPLHCCPMSSQRRSAITVSSTLKSLKTMLFCMASLSPVYMSLTKMVLSPPSFFMIPTRSATALIRSSTRHLVT